MTDFACDAFAAKQQRSINDHTAADTGADGDIHKVIGVPSAAK